MSAATTDNFTEVSAAGNQTTLAAPGKAIGATSIILTSPTGWPTVTGIIVALRRVNASGVYQTGTYTEFEGVLVGSTITLNPTPLYGTDQVYAADGLTQVFQPLSYNAWNKFIATILNQHTQAGAHVGLTNTGGMTNTGGLTTDSLTITGSNVSAGWNALGQTLTYSANNGQKEFVVTAAANLLSTLSVGMKLQITRNTVPPTQCMAFTAASNQYASKTTPAGITFTSAFTVESWIFPLSYAGSMVIGGRLDGAYANGFWIQLTTNGQLEVAYAASSSSTTWSSTQAIPLNQWTHVAAVVSSVASKTLQGIYMNGVSVPTTSLTSAATTLTQSSNLGVGANPTTPGAYFNGYVSEFRIWSVAQTAAAIDNNMAINCIGTESNLVCLIPGAGNFNDLTSNANNLTASGGAIATQTNNPYQPIEYGIITSISYSNPTTTLKVYTGNSNTIPNATLNSAQYSVVSNPYGFNASKRNWRVEVPQQGQVAQTSATSGVWYNIASYQISVPSGDWMLGYECNFHVAPLSGSTGPVSGTLASASAVQTDAEFNSEFEADITSIVGVGGTGSRKKGVSLAAQALYYFNIKHTATTGTTYLRGDNITNKLYAECAYV